MTDETPPVIAIVKKIIIIIPKSEFLLFLTGPSEGMQTRRLIKQSQHAEESRKMPFTMSVPRLWCSTSTWFNPLRIKSALTWDFQMPVWMLVLYVNPEEFRPSNESCCLCRLFADPHDLVSISSVTSRITEHPSFLLWSSLLFALTLSEF